MKTKRSVVVFKEPALGESFIFRGKSVKCLPVESLKDEATGACAYCACYPHGCPDRVLCSIKRDTEIMLCDMRVRSDGEQVYFKEMEDWEDSCYEDTSLEDDGELV